MVAAELAAHRLHHDPVSRRAEERRPVAARRQRPSTAPAEWQTFRWVVFPALRPINIVVLVITVIESLRAFDLVYVINKGRNGLELLSVLVTQNIMGEASRIGFGSAIGGDHAADLAGVHRRLPGAACSGRTGDDDRWRRPRGAAGARGRAGAGPPAQAVTPGRVLLHAFLAVTSLALLFPLVYAVYTSLRPYAETAQYGYFSLPRGLTVANYTNAWTAGRLAALTAQHPHHRGAGAAADPAAVLVRGVRAGRFGCARHMALLMLFTAGNLLPQQIIMTPLYRRTGCGTRRAGSWSTQASSTTRTGASSRSTWRSRSGSAPSC